jgi:uncharacterized membrane protein HdeD (DUF308 family)
MSEIELRNQRVVKIISGVIIIILAILVSIFSVATIAFLLILVSLTLIIFGLFRILNKVFEKNLELRVVASQSIFDLLLIIIGIIMLISVIVNPVGSILATTIFLAIISLLFGCILISYAILNKKYSKLSRRTVLIIGVVTVIISILILAFPAVGFAFLVALINIYLLVYGIKNIIDGIQSFS